MISKNNFKPGKKKTALYFLVFLVTIWILIRSIDFRQVIDEEVQNYQSFFDNFSSPTQLYDEGNLYSNISSTDKLIKISKGLIRSIYLKLSNEEIRNLKKMNLFIKFEHLSKILSDREKALKRNINISPSKVPCKISDGREIFKCSVRLKGDLSDHWQAKTRLSLRVKVKGGFIHGFNEFSIQKPRSRQFPYDLLFQKNNAKLGNLSSSDQDFWHVTLNNSKLGVMNIEPVVNKYFIEKRGLKRGAIFKIANEQGWHHNNLKNSYPGYFPGDEQTNLDIKGNLDKFLKEEKSRKIFSYIFYKLSMKKSDLFERDLMILNLAHSLAWGNTHALFNSNAQYIWNAYTKKLEPILTDQVHWRNLKEPFLHENNGSKLLYKATGSKIPYEFKMLFAKQPLSYYEFNNAIKVVRDNYLENNPLEDINIFKERYFPADSKFKESPIMRNIEYLEQNLVTTVDKINSLSLVNSEFRNATRITHDQIKQLKKYTDIIYFSDGLLRVFNLLDRPVKIESISSDNLTIEINQLVPPSIKHDLSYYDLRIDSTILNDKNITINVSLDSLVKRHKVKFSLDKIGHEGDSFIQNERGICKSKKIDEEICYISGHNSINKTVFIKDKAVILPGTVINLASEANIAFLNSLEVRGTPTYKVVFNGSNTSGIYIKNSSKNISTIENVDFNNLGNFEDSFNTYSGSVNGYNGEFVLKNVSFLGGSSEDQLNIVHAKIHIENLNIKNAPSDGFDCDFCEGKIIKSKIENSKGDGLDFSGSNLIIDDYHADNIKDKAVSIGESSHIKLSNLNIFNSATGIAVKDSSSAIVNGIKVKDIKFDSFMTYIKKPFYEGKTSLEVNNYSSDKDLLCTRQKNTFLTVNNIPCGESELNVKELYSGRMRK